MSDRTAEKSARNEGPEDPFHNVENPARARILREAAGLFRTLGYDGATMRDLAGRVGIQSGSIFHHFASKEEILAEVMENAIIHLISRTEAARDEADTPTDRLRNLLRNEFRCFNEGPSDAYRVLFHQWERLSEARQKPLLRYRSRYEAMWREILDACAEAGRLRGDPAILRRLIHGATVWSIYWFRPGKPLSTDALADEAFGLLVTAD